MKHQFVLHPDMIISGSGCGFATWVADEQNAPLPTTFWEPYKEKYCEGTKAMLGMNLGIPVRIINLHIYSRDNSNISISSFLKKEKKLGTEFKLASGWNIIPLNSPIDFIELDFEIIKGIGEILIETDKLYSGSKTLPTTRLKPLMQDFIGTNAFVDVPGGLLEPFGCIREYHDWSWSEQKEDSVCLNVTCNGFDMQLFYTNLFRLGKKVIPVIQKTPNWISWTAQKRPVKEKLNAQLPASYNGHSYFMQTYAQNFSKMENGAIEYFENWNEPDRWWDGPECYFTPFQYAAMSSADVDGDVHKMGPRYGFREKSSQSKMVMAGLAYLKLDYLHGLKYWCDKYRKGDFAWDVINYHQYANSSHVPGDQKMEEMKGICPEEAGIFQKTKEITDFRDKYLPNVPVWNTEFGFDTEKSPQQCHPIGEKSSELVQADWLIRSYLLLSAAGVEKAFQYMIRDFGKEGYYATSGVYSSTLKDRPYRKPAWFYIYTLRNVLYNSTFEKLQVDSVSQIYTITYRNTVDTLLKTILIWHGTEMGKVTKNYQLPTSVRNRLRLIEFEPYTSCGKISSLSKGMVSVSETPIMVQEHPSGLFSPCSELKKINRDSIVCLDENGKEDRILLDEIGQDQDPAMGNEGQMPSTVWKRGYQSRTQEHRVFDFGREKNVHSVYIFDGSGAGEIMIYAKKGSDWVSIGKTKMSYYKKWKCYTINVKTRYIKIERMDCWDEIGDVVYYETKTN
jgi:hypothetical protein